MFRSLSLSLPLFLSPFSCRLFHSTSSSTPNSFYPQFHPLSLTQSHHLPPSHSLTLLSSPLSLTLTPSLLPASPHSLPTSLLQLHSICLPFCTPLPSLHSVCLSLSLRLSLFLTLLNHVTTKVLLLTDVCEVNTAVMQDLHLHTHTNTHTQTNKQTNTHKQTRRHIPACILTSV